MERCRAELILGYAEERGVVLQLPHRVTDCPTAARTLRGHFGGSFDSWDCPTAARTLRVQCAAKILTTSVVFSKRLRCSYFGGSQRDARMRNLILALLWTLGAGKFYKMHLPEMLYRVARPWYNSKWFSPAESLPPAA